MLSFLSVACLATTSLAPQDPPPATQPAQPAANERVWTGYLFVDAKDRLQLGWPVVAMGVMAMPAHLIGGELGKTLRPLACPAKGNWVFLNYSLERSGETPAAEIPRYLVTLRGRVEKEGGEEEPGGIGFGSGRGELTLADARVQTVEVLAEEWLQHWAFFFKDKRSPFRIATDNEKAEGKALEKLLHESLAVLQAMRAVPEPDAAQRAKLRELVPQAAVGQRFRREKEVQIQRWLVDVCAKGKLQVPGLDKLPPLPPASTEVQKWFLGAETLKAFLAKVDAEWKGARDALELVHYVAEGNSTSYHVSNLQEILDLWQEADFQRHQATTRKMLGGR